MTSEVGHKALVLLLTIVAFIGIPIILILSAPLIIFRFVVKKIAPCLRPELKKMVTARGCISAADDYTNCPNSNVVQAIVLEGQVDLERGVECAGKRLLEARLSNGEVKYPELKQYVTTWFGYYFWINDKKFDIKNHVKIHQVQEKFTEEDIQDLRENMLHEPWAEKRPMWDVSFVPNCYPVGLKSPGPHTVLIVRMHHTFGGGKAWVPLIVQELCQSEMKFPEPNYPKRSFCGNIVDQITFPFRASYHFADALSIGFRKNVPFTVKKGMHIGKYNTTVSNIISIKKIKGISRHFNVCFSSVISAALAGAMRDLLISKGKKIPMVIYFLSAQPLPGDSLKLRSHITGVILKFPVGEADPVKRLKYCDANYQKIKKSAQPRLFDFAWVIAGSYFSWMVKYLGQNHTVTTSISNFPGPSNDSVHFNGHKWLDFMFIAGLQPGATGLAFGAMSFVDGLRISLNAASGVLSRAEVNELAALIFKHVDILHQRIVNDA